MDFVVTGGWFSLHQLDQWLAVLQQDFKTAFGVGGSDTGITTVDADGVALAAIQGLNEKLREELRRRDAENAELKQRLAALEKIVLKRED